MEDNKMPNETTNYYDELKKESYKTLLDAEIQASASRDRALKYTNAGINANGYGGQGIAESTKLGVGNQYQQALQNANSQYRNEIANIQQQEREENLANANDQFESMTTLMNSSTSQEQLNDIMTRYGVTPNADGTFTYSDDSPLTTNDKRQLEILYNMQNESLKKSGYEGRELNLEEGGYVYQKDGSVQHISSDDMNTEDGFKHGLLTIKAYASYGRLPNDCAIKLEKKNGKTMYLKYINNTLYYITPEEFDDTDVKFTQYSTKTTLNRV
jgi:hypothetical protein